jgi:hypothetical protein
VALKKSQLYSSLWQSCDELRGGMDALVPQWRLHREELNRAPLAHEDWQY